MMKWRPWPPLTSKKFEAKIVIRRLQGLHYAGVEQDSEKLAVEVKWKGSKPNALTSFRRSVRRNFTREESLIRKDDDGVVEWDEEFFSVCNFSAIKEGLFYPWEVSFTVFNVSSQFGFFFGFNFLAVGFFYLFIDNDICCLLPDLSIMDSCLVAQKV